MLVLLNKNYLNYLNQKFSEFGLNANQAFMLLKLSDVPDFSQQDLGDYLSLSKGSVAKYLADLEEKGFIKRERVANNKRKYNIILEDTVLEIVPKLKNISHEWELKAGLHDLNSDFYNDFKRLYGNSNKILEEEN